MFRHYFKAVIAWQGHLKGTVIEILSVKNYMYFTVCKVFQDVPRKMGLRWMCETMKNDHILIILTFTHTDRMTNRVWQVEARLQTP